MTFMMQNDSNKVITLESFKEELENNYDEYYFNKNRHLKKLLVAYTSFLSVDSKPACRVWHILTNNLDNVPKCKCDLIELSWNQRNNTYRQHCVNCAKKDLRRIEKIKNTTVARHGGIGTQLKKNLDNIKKIISEKKEEIVAKRKNTFKEKYGIEHALQKNEFLIKSKITSMNRFGVEHASQSDEIKLKVQNYFDETYGCHPMQDESLRQKHTTAIYDDFGRHVKQQHISLDSLKILNDPTELSNLNKTQSLSIIAEKLGVSPSKICTVFKGFNIQINRSLTDVSVGEFQLLNFLKNECSVKNILERDRTILKPQELDIVLPDFNMAIEFNGSYWHSELNGKNKNYHLSKTVKCKNMDISLVHIWGHEWINKQNILKSRISTMLGLSNKIYARKCKVIYVDNLTRKIFLNNNHLQGDANTSINYGLEVNGELVALMTFSKSRLNNNYEYELVRYCSKLNLVVVGGASKLLNMFENEYDPKSIISYADKRFGSGNMYSKLGFCFLHDSSPNYFYTNDYNKFESRQKYQKHKLVKDGYDSNKTEWEIMQERGYDRIWDCGNAVYIKTK